jgi:hypothetical protein
LVKICGGQALAFAKGSQPAGLVEAAVAVTGIAAAQAELPVVASFTNQTGHAEKVTVTGMVASVSMTLNTSAAAARRGGGRRSQPTFSTCGGMRMLGDVLAALGRLSADRPDLTILKASAATMPP